MQRASEVPMPQQMVRLAAAVRWHQAQVREAMAEVDRHVAAAQRAMAELQKLTGGAA